MALAAIQLAVRDYSSAEQTCWKILRGFPANPGNEPARARAKDLLFRAQNRLK